MKRLTFKISVLLSAALFIYGCAKERQNLVNDLEGSWQVTKEVYDGEVSPDSLISGIVYKFENCKIKKDPCDGAIVQDGKSQAFTYDVNDDADELTLKLDGSLFASFGFELTEAELTQVLSIVEKTDTKLVLDYVDAENILTTTTLEKL